MILAAIEHDMAEFRLQDGRIFRIMRKTPESYYKLYIWDTNDLSWSEAEWFGKGGKKWYRDALASFMSLVPFG